MGGDVEDTKGWIWGGLEGSFAQNFVLHFDAFYPNVTTLCSGLCHRKSVCRLSVVCNVRAPYSGGRNFRQYFFAILYLSHSLTSVQNRPREIPPSGALNARGVAK